jgi:hypothetical protein
MKAINQELIPNKSILSFGYWSNINLDEYLLSVTRGMATAKQKKACYQQFQSELSLNETNLNETLFKSSKVFELWFEGKLIGLCKNTAIARDWLTEAAAIDEEPEEKNSKTLFITSSLEAVFILKKHRNKELSHYFAGVISTEQFKQMLGFITHHKGFTFNHIDNHFFCEYYSEPGEHFHQLLYGDDLCGYAQRVLTQLGYTYEVTISAD